MRKMGRRARADAHPALDETPQLPGQSAKHGDGTPHRGGDAGHRGHRHELPAHQGTSVSVEREPVLGRPLGPGWRDQVMMKGAYLPGNSSVEMRELPVPEPGHGE